MTDTYYSQKHQHLDVLTLALAADVKSSVTNPDVDDSISLTNPMNDNDTYIDDNIDYSLLDVNDNDDNEIDPNNLIDVDDNTSDIYSFGDIDEDEPDEIILKAKRTRTNDVEVLNPLMFTNPYDLNPTRYKSQIKQSLKCLTISRAAIFEVLHAIQSELVNLSILILSNILDSISLFRRVRLITCDDMWPNLQCHKYDSFN